MHTSLEPNTGHTNGFANAFLGINDELLGQDVKNALVSRNRHCTRCVDDTVDITRGHLFVTDGDNAVGVQTGDVAPSDTGVDRFDLTARHQLRLFHRALNGLHRRLDVDYHTLFQAPRPVMTDSDDLDFAIC